jgi:hypothetical protein
MSCIYLGVGRTPGFRFCAGGGARRVESAYRTRVRYNWSRVGTGSRYHRSIPAESSQGWGIRWLSTGGHGEHRKVVQRQGVSLETTLIFLTCRSKLESNLALTAPVLCGVLFLQKPVLPDRVQNMPHQQELRHVVMVISAWSRRGLDYC